LAVLLLQCESLTIKGCFMTHPTFEVAAAHLVTSPPYLRYFSMEHSMPIQTHKKDAVSQQHGFQKFMNILVGSSPYLEHIDVSDCVGRGVLKDAAAVLECLSKAHTLRIETGLPPLMTITFKGLANDLEGLELMKSFESSLLGEGSATFFLDTKGRFEARALQMIRTVV
jgi:hypothetical protein